MSYLLVLAIGAVLPKIIKKMIENNKLKNVEIINNDYYEKTKKYPLTVNNSPMLKKKIMIENVTKETYHDNQGNQYVIERVEYEREREL